MAEWKRMDLTWFAVDRDGHVAIFFAQESGAIPQAAQPADDYETVIAALHTASPREWADAIDDDGSDGAEEFETVPDGVFSYSCEGGWLAWPYEREEMDTTPLRASTLPRAVTARMLEFDGRFSRISRIQPLEHWSCSTPGAVWLASDTIRIRCVPGREQEFAAEAAEAIANLDLDECVIESPPGSPVLRNRSSE